MMDASLRFSIIIIIILFSIKMAQNRKLSSASHDSSASDHSRDGSSSMISEYLFHIEFEQH